MELSRVRPRVAPPPAVVTGLRDADAAGLLSQCPHAGKASRQNEECRRERHEEKLVQFNPFLTAAEGYAEVLRRGLEQSRHEKVADHEETLAHLAALAAHFEQLGQPEAARPFAEEHTRLIAKIATSQAKWSCRECLN